MDTWHALIVEDEADSAEVVSRVLEHHKISHVVASSAEDALLMLQTQAPDIMIVDLALPGMDGMQFLRRLRANPQTATIPAVAVTAYHSTGVHEDAIAAGFAAYFPKPFDKLTFVRELERLLNRS